MDASEKEAIKGMILDKWIDDLRQDRAPLLLPEVELLNREEIEETMQLARWFKASIYRQETASGSEVDAVAASLRKRVLQERGKEQEVAASIAEKAADFGSMLEQARRRRGINAQLLEQALSVPEGFIHRLESANLPPHRIPIDKMISLLRSLRIQSARAVELAHRASLVWTESAYTRPQTQLGRIDPRLSIEERYQLLDGSETEDRNALAREVEAIEEYHKKLAASLN